MIFLVYILGLLLVLGGGFLTIKSGYCFEFLLRNKEKRWVYITAIITRIVIGGLLIYLAGLSKLPLLISTLGWVILVAGIVLFAIGRSKFEKLMVWALSTLRPYGVAAGLFSIGFGVFLIYIFV